MILAYVPSISTGVLDSGVAFSLIRVAKEREKFERGGWREERRKVSIFSLPYLRSLFRVSLTKQTKNQQKSRNCPEWDRSI